MKNIKIYFAVALCFCMLLVTSLFAYAVELDAAENAYVMQNSQDANLQESTLKPGTNIFTGTANALTFETEADLSYVSLAPAWDKTAVIDYQIGERTAYNGIGKSLMFKNTNGKTDASMHFVTKLTATMPIIVDRPAVMIARVGDAYTQWRNGGILRSNTAGDWKKGEIIKAFEGDSILNSDSVSIDVWSLDGNSYWMYFDNLAVIPYYQITYKNILPDGTTGDDIVKYELDTTNLTVATNDGVIAGLPTEFVPAETLSYEGVELLGWSTDENATEPMETIVLANEDITLYPVWEASEPEEPVHVLKPGVNAFTGNTSAVTFETEADLKYVSLAPAWDKTAVIDYQIGERTAYNGIGKSLMFKNTNGKTDASMHFVTKLTATMPITVDRPAVMIARVGDAYTQWRNGGILRSNTAGDWKKGEIIKAFDGDSILNSDSVSIDVWSLDGNSYWMYFDNLAVIPYYQITYKNILPDGTIGEDIVKYELDTTNITVATNDGVIAGLPSTYTPAESLSYTGKKLLGWSTDENATEAMETVALANEDIVLYPVWGYDEAVVTPVTATTTEVRTTSPAGIRFKAEISHQVRHIDTDAVEYGFIVTTEKHIGSYELTFDSGVNYVYGKAYDNTESLDKVYADGDEGVTFTGVMMGIPDNKTAYTTKIIARSYVKIGNSYFYGNTHTDSLYDAVSRMDEALIADFPYLQNVIETVEG